MVQGEVWTVGIPCAASRSGGEGESWSRWLVENGMRTVNSHALTRWWSQAFHSCQAPSDREALFSGAI
jgi:hypothetical protein